MRIENGLPRIPPPQAAVTLLKGESYVKRTLLIVCSAGPGTPKATISRGTASFLTPCRRDRLNRGKRNDCDFRDQRRKIRGERCPTSTSASPHRRGGGPAGRRLRDAHREAGLLDVARHRPPCQRAVHPDLEGHPPLARATFRPNILAILAPRIGFELMGMDRRGPPGEPGNCHCQIICNYLLKMVIELDRPGGLRDNPEYDSRPAAPAKGVEANARRTVHESMARATLSVGRNVGREGS